MVKGSTGLTALPAGAVRPDRAARVVPVGGMAPVVLADPVGPVDLVGPVVLADPVGPVDLVGPVVLVVRAEPVGDRVDPVVPVDQAALEALAVRAALEVPVVRAVPVEDRVDPVEDRVDPAATSDPAVASCQIKAPLFFPSVSLFLPLFPFDAFRENCLFFIREPATPSSAEKMSWRLCPSRNLLSPPASWLKRSPTAPVWPPV